MDREQFNRHSIIVGNDRIKNLINFLLDKVEERGIAYFISVRKGGIREFTIKSETDSGVIATIELRKNGIDIELHVKCADTGDINESVLNLIKKSYLD